MTEAQRPVWIAFPRIPWGSIGWRMGHGEVYWHDWISWFRALSDTERDTYMAAWPEPAGWEGFYAFLETGTLPARFTAEEEFPSEAKLVPSQSETEIVDGQRIRWLVRNFFKHEGGRGCFGPDEGVAEYYRAPDGSRWLFTVSLSTSKPKLTRDSL